MRKSSHSVTELRYHIVLVTKKRRPYLVDDIEDTVKSECERIIDHFNGTVEKMETDTDHIHLLVDLPPRYSISEVVNVLKGVSSRIVRRDHGDRLKGNAFWSPSYYAATTGGASIDVIKQYIETQKER